MLVPSHLFSCAPKIQFPNKCLLEGEIDREKKIERKREGERERERESGGENENEAERERVRGAGTINNTTDNKLLESP